jgi:hypothetical protein
MQNDFGENVFYIEDASGSARLKELAWQQIQQDRARIEGRNPLLSSHI